MKSYSQLKMSQKDFQKVSEWYKVTKNNYFKWNQQQTVSKEQFREVHLRIYFSQIYFTDTFLSSQLDFLRNLTQNCLSITGGILKSEEQQFEGKPYENKNIQAYFDMNSKSLILREQVNLYSYTLETKKRDSVFFLELSLTNSQGDNFRLGKLELNMNSNLNQISELVINNKNNQKVSFIQSIIDKQPIKDFPRFLPPNLIIDQKVSIPGIKTIEMKNRREPIILQTRSKMKIMNVQIKIGQREKLMQKLRRINPFSGSHYENVEITQINYKLKIGNHNSWKFIDIKDEINNITLKVSNQSSEKSQNQSKQLELISDFNKGFLAKTYFQCPNCVFPVLLYAEICYKYEGFVEKKRQNLGWCIVSNKIYEPSIKFESFLQTNHYLPGYQIKFLYQGIKLFVQIQNPDHKYYRKKYEEQFPEKVNFQKIFYDENSQQLTKTIFVKRETTERSAMIASMSTFKDLNQTQRQLQQLIQEVENQMEKIKRKIIIKGHFVAPQQKQEVRKQTDWQKLLKLQKKHIKLGIKLTSMIPETDEVTYQKGEFYLPLKFKTKINIMRKKLQIDSHFLDVNASWNVPVFIKSSRQTNNIEALIKDRQELKKVMDSPMLVSLWDTYNDIFYGKGQLQVMDIFSSQQGRRFEVQLFNEAKKMGILVLQILVSLQSGDTASNKRQVEPIQKTSIIQSLPMKQRLMMRISNFNSSNSELQNQAISYYKQKYFFYQQRNMQNVINKITNSEVNCVSEVQFELGEPCYYLLQFTNTSQSQNNMFSFFVRGCDFVEIVTDEKEYKQVIVNNNFNAIPYNKIQFHRQNNHDSLNYAQRLTNEWYTSKLKHNQSIGLLLKVCLFQWNAKIKPQSLLQVEIQRNTMTVTTMKLKLLFKPPIIHRTITLFEINKNTNKGIYLNFPPQITQNYEQFVSFSKDLTIKNKPKLQFKLQTSQNFKSPHKIQLLIKGKIPISQLQEKVQNILVQVNLLDGQFIEVELGQISNKSFLIDSKANPYLKNQILILSDKNLSKSLISKNSVFIVSEETKVDLVICSFTKGLQNIIVKFFNLQFQVQYQYLLKIITKLKRVPQMINVQNFVGQKIIIDCVNPYVSGMQFYIFSSTDSVKFDRLSVSIQPKSNEKVIVQILNKLYQKCFIGIYDEQFLLTQLFQLNFFDQTAFKMFKIDKQNDFI